MKLTQLTLLLLGFSAVFHGNSQGLEPTEVTLMGGKNFSSFLFRNSDSEKDKTLEYTMNNSFGINLALEAGKHVLRPELMFRQGGAQSTFNGTSLSWKLNYVDLNAGYLYRLLQTERFSVSPGIAIGAGYLLKGEQYIGDARYSIVENKTLKRFDLTAHGIANFRATLSETISLSLEYRFGMGLVQIENDINSQKSRNIYQAALLGIGIRLN